MSFGVAQAHTGFDQSGLSVFGLLHVKDGESSGENSFSRDPEKVLAEYVRNAISLGRSLRESGIPFVCLTNAPDRVRLLARAAGVSEIEFRSIDFSLNVPQGIRFYGAHFKLDVFRYLGTCSPSGWFALVDLDVILVGEDVSLLRKIVSEKKCVYYDISRQVCSQYGLDRVRSDLSLLHGRASSATWAGGEFIGGPAAFFATLAETAVSLFPRYLEVRARLHHHGDEMVTSASLELMSQQGQQFIDAGSLGLVSRYWTRWGIPMNSYSKSRGSLFLHLPSDKTYLSRIATEPVPIREAFNATYEPYRRRKLLLEAIKAVGRLLHLNRLRG